MFKQWISASSFASLFAGPIFWIALGLAELISKAFAPDRDWSPQLTEYLSVLPASVIFGFVLAILPNALGTALMLAASRRIPIARHWLAWTAAGAAMAAVLALLFGASLSPDGFGGLAATTMTGASCARLCRSRVSFPSSDADLASIF